MFGKHREIVKKAKAITRKIEPGREDKTGKNQLGQFEALYWYAIKENLI